MGNYEEIKRRPKYHVTETYCFPLRNSPLPDDVAVHLYDEDGKPLVDIDNAAMYVRPGYEWDGASGPTIDTDNTMEAALLHDVAYQCLRERVLPHPLGTRSHKQVRKWADKEFRRFLKQEGMFIIRRWYYYLGVRGFAAYAARPPGEDSKR